MPWKQQVLVVANLTATSHELLGVLRERVQREPTEVHLVIPASPLGSGRQAAMQTLEDALEKVRSAGLDADGAVGHPDPFLAVMEVWDPKRYDEIVVSTLPIGASKWLHAGLPERIGRATGALVTHVVAQPVPQAISGKPPPAHERLGILRPLSVLGWAPSKHA